MSIPNFKLLNMPGGMFRSLKLSVSSVMVQKVIVNIYTTSINHKENYQEVPVASDPDPE